MARPEKRSLAILVLAWLALHFAGIFSPGLLDDVDSMYIEVAREMLHRHDFITPCLDGIRFFDKPPLMYWLAAGSMRLFGETDWAARLPLALAVLALFLAIYALGLRLYSERGALSERSAFYSALIFATAIGPYLYTRFFLPDLLLCLWMTLGIHCFLIAVDRLSHPLGPGPLIPGLGFAATLALNLLTKGFIGLVFPLGFVLLYLVLTRRLRLLLKLPLIPSTLLFLAIALPWHILAAIRNPAIAIPQASDSPPKPAGHGSTSITNTSPASSAGASPTTTATRPSPSSGSTPSSGSCPGRRSCPPHRAALPPVPPQARPPERSRPGHLALGDPRARLLHHLQPPGVLLAPAIPALALMIGGVLALADHEHTIPVPSSPSSAPPARPSPRGPSWPSSPAIAGSCSPSPPSSPPPALTSPSPRPHPCAAPTSPPSSPTTRSSTRLARPSLRPPLRRDGLLPRAAPRRRHRHGRPRPGQLRPAPPLTHLCRQPHARPAGMTLCLLAAHEGLVRFNPILGSQPLAEAILADEQLHPEPAIILLDGELTSGSTILFLHPPARPPRQRTRQHRMVRQLLARRAAHPRNRSHPSPAMGRP